MFGEAVVLYETVPGCGACCGGACGHLCTCCHVFNVGVDVPQVPRHCCGAANIILPCVKDAAALAKAINEARDLRLQQQGLKVETEMAR